MDCCCSVVGLVRQATSSRASACITVFVVGDRRAMTMSHLAYFVPAILTASGGCEGGSILQRPDRVAGRTGALTSVHFRTLFVELGASLCGL